MLNFEEELKNYELRLVRIDEGLMLDTFVAVNQINNGEKNAVFD